MKKVRTHYDNLKVARNATPEAIRAAYKTLSQKYHPDRNGNSAESRQVMKMIDDAYAVLSDPEARSRHDAWIAEQESPTPVKENVGSDSIREIEFSTPVPGHINFYDLDEDSQRRIKERALGLNNNQLRIKLDGVIKNYCWCAILSILICVLFLVSRDGPWSDNTTKFYFGGMTLLSFLLAKNIVWIFSWHTKPLKSWLLVTPLYLIKLQFDKISYWPIWTISDIKATHRHSYGIYTDTEVKIVANNKRETFHISPESAYQEFVNRLRTFDAHFRSAVNSRDLNYLLNNDNFFKVRADGVKTKKRAPVASIAAYTLLPLLALLAIGINYQEYADMPARHRPYYTGNSAPYIQPKLSPKPGYVRPDTAPNGAPWPTTAAYVAEYPQLNEGGLSILTIDNIQNDSDVFVKLVALKEDEANPVRFFFIPAFQKFTLEKIDAGAYDVRYRDLTTGRLSRSEDFTLNETPIENGTRYSNVTMTLYKVQHGNMETYALSEDEF